MNLLNTRVVILLACFLIILSCRKDKKINYHSFETEVESSLPVDETDILQRMKYYNVPGVSIAVVANGKLDWAKGYGIANTKNGYEVDENTLFQAGSISKPIAAIAALQLASEGKIELNSDVNDYLKNEALYELYKNEENKKSTDTLLRYLLEWNSEE